MQEIIDSIKATEAKISSASAKSKEILGQIIELQEQAAECNLLQGRYATLRGQYVSDIKRLSFIVNGEVEMQKVAHNTICPFCDGKIPAKSKKSYIESAQAELHRITKQGVLSRYNEGKLRITPEKIQTFPDILPFDKAIFNSFIEEFTLDDDKAEYKTNFGLTLSSTGNRRTLSNFLGFKKAKSDGTLVFVDAVYKVGDNAIQFRG